MISIESVNHTEPKICVSYLCVHIWLSYDMEVPLHLCSVSPAHQNQTNTVGSYCTLEGRRPTHYKLC